MSWLEAYQQTAQSKITEILGWHHLRPEELPKLDADIRRLLIKDLECNCPFQRKGQPYRIWRSEIRILFGTELRDEAQAQPPAPEPQQSSFF